MHNRARGHASFMLTCTRSLRCWRKCQKHHAVVDHACDKRGSVMHQSAARSGVGLMGFVRSVIVHNKTQRHVERPCSHIAAVSTQQAAPVANESSCVKSSQSKIHLRCPTARMLQLLLGRAQRPGQSARASAPPSLLKRLSFKFENPTLCHFLFFPCEKGV